MTLICSYDEARYAQDGKVGMTVGNWLNAQGIALPAKLVRAAPRPSAEPESAKPAGRAEKLPIRKAANPEKHLADLRALLELHGELAARRCLAS